MTVPSIHDDAIGPDAVEHGHQGRVKDPAHDGRLKQNRKQGVSLHTTDQLAGIRHGAQGRVRDPAHDRRLKRNRA